MQHLFHDVEGRRFADIVGAAFEGQAEDADFLATEGPQSGADFLEEAAFLFLVDLLDFLEEREVDAELVGDVAECGDVFRETGAAVAYACAQELGTDAAIHAHAAGHFFNVGADRLADVGDDVDEGNFGGEKRVRCVLDDLGRFGRGEQDGRCVAFAVRSGDSIGRLVIFAGREGLVNGLQQIAGAIGVGSDDDAVGVEEVDDGGAFAEELGIGGHVEQFAGDAVSFDDAADPLVGVNGDRAFFNDDFVLIDGAGDFAGDRIDVGEVCAAGTALRRSYGDENGLRGFGGGSKVAGELDGLAAMASQELGR
jgi:hypothetical protein